MPPLEPTTPTASGWSSLIEPLPLIVVATGADKRSASSSKLGLGLRHHHAAAADENRTRCVLQQTTCALDARGVRREPLGRVAAKAWLAPNFRSLDRAVLHVEGERDVRRAGTAGGDLFESARETRAASLLRG